MLSYSCLKSKRMLYIFCIFVIFNSLKNRTFLRRIFFVHFFSKKKLLLSLTFVPFIVSCASIFEHNYDVMARQALFDLMRAQETYHAKHNKYANNLGQFSNQDLKYHTGIVYLEIQSANKNGYRAISLPAESSTARVFVYDTSKGGYYEADEVEVSKYVLGALNFVRHQKAIQKTNILLISILLFSLVYLGFRFVSRYKGKENNEALISYFFSLPALGWAVTTLNLMNKDIAFNSSILILSSISIVLSLSCVFIAIRWLGNSSTLTTPTPVLGLTGCSVFVSLISLGIVGYVLVKYYPA